MSAAEWYYAQEDKQIGPVSPAQMRQLAGAGVLRPDDLVWSEGMKQWAPARSVAGLFDRNPSKTAETFSGTVESDTKTAEPATAAPLADRADRTSPPTSRRAGRALFDVVLDFLRVQFPPLFVDSAATIFGRCGHYGLYLVMLLVAVFSVVADIQSGSLHGIRFALAAVLILAVLQYAASRLWAPLERLNRISRCRIASAVVPDCLALLCLAAGIIVLLCDALVAAVAAGSTNEYWLILSGLSAFIILTYAGFVSLSPQALHVEVAADIPAEQEALGVVCFLLKVALRVVPVGYGVGVLAGIMRLTHPFCLVFAAGAPMGDAAGRLGLPSQVASQPAEAAALDAIVSIVYYAALPLAGYLAFLLGYLVIELIRAWLPGLGRAERPVEESEG
ncbi:MAG: hypothetical protein A2V70_06500 [Planctomycetes bacterium RBG_13_63_9]|nr:MAG: hypothetical protein A2V70_06500 [Planctomycetes bacterium RBG_13_63_9]